MCKNLQPIDDKEAIVYKIVAKKKRGTRYYSIAMGFMYPKIAGRIPKIKVQHRIGEYFSRYILDKEAGEGYVGKMVGKTAGFINREDAEKRAGWLRDAIKTHDILIITAKLTDGLMSGNYGVKSIIAGKHIEFLD